jgi:hypothetical protein
MIANAVEQFAIKLRNEGFTRLGLPCVTQRETRLLGYASTSGTRTANLSIIGEDIWIGWRDTVDRMTPLRLAVIQDGDATLGSEACLGEVRAFAQDADRETEKGGFAC